MNTYRFIHLSDIHFGQERDGEIELHSDVREQVLADCEILSKKLGKATGVLVTGDIAFSGKSNEYKDAGEWLDRLLEIVGCDENSIRMVPGNHDVDLTCITRGVELWHNDIRKSKIDEIDLTFESIFKNEVEAELFFNKLNSYCEFAASYDSDYSSIQKPMWVKELPLDDVNTLCLVGLNSVQVSDKSDDLRKLFLGRKQYILQEKKNVEYIVLGHHPLEWFKDLKLAKSYLKRAIVLMFGHEHELQIEIKDDKKGHKWLELHAGATTPPEAKSDSYNYRYNWIEFSTHNDGKDVLLKIVVYPRVWQWDPPKFVKDTSYGGNEDEGIVVELPCSHFSIIESESTKVGATTKEILTDKAVESKTMTNQPNEEQFSKLRFFFWRYLDWRQRLEVLVKLDALPKTLEKPIPQTMEKLALEELNRKGKLSNLWNAVMEYVPIQKRKENPFLK